MRNKTALYEFLIRFPNILWYFLINLESSFWINFNSLQITNHYIYNHFIGNFIIWIIFEVYLR